MDVPFREFEESCAKAFHFLVDRFGFQPPVVERIGRESYVRFHKGPRTVSIAWEPGGPPVVEMFLPTAGSGLPETPWAERDGVPYSRRFPRTVGSTIPMPQQRSHKVILRELRRTWDRPTADTFETDLRERAERLERSDLDFLSEDEI